MSVHIFIARWIFWVRVRGLENKLLFTWEMGRKR
jgi:hypothetical protein